MARTRKAEKIVVRKFAKRMEDVLEYHKRETENIPATFEKLNKHFLGLSTAIELKDCNSMIGKSLAIGIHAARIMDICDKLDIRSKEYLKRMKR